MAGQDPNGFYAALGCEPGASSYEVREAYRRLGKIADPAVNAELGTAEEWGRIQAAFAVLGDRDAKAAYDKTASPAPAPVAAAPAATPAVTDAPLHVELPADRPFETPRIIPCSSCHKVEHIPRHTSFLWVISVLVMTFKQPVNSILCAKCATQTGFISTLVTSFIGWWGFPWGPIYSLQAIFNNVGGGPESIGANAELAFSNALAMRAQGDNKTAYALALQGAKGGAFIRESRHLAEELRPYLPLADQNPRDPWKRSALEVGLHFAAGFALPILLVITMVVLVATAPPSSARSSANLADNRYYGPSFAMAGGPLRWSGGEAYVYVETPVERDGAQVAARVLYVRDHPPAGAPLYTRIDTQFDCAAGTITNANTEVYNALKEVVSTDAGSPSRTPDRGSAAAAALHLACESDPEAAASLVTPDLETALEVRAEDVPERLYPPPVSRAK